MIAEETTYLRSKLGDYNPNIKKMDLYLFPIDTFSQFNLDNFYNKLRENLSLNVFSDIGKGLQRPSAEIVENAWGMPYVMARGREAKKRVKRILKRYGNELIVDFQGIRKVKADSPSRLARRLGFLG